MILRQLRWVAAGLAVVAAVCASPARSKADVVILIEELNASGMVVASQSTPLSGSGVTPMFTGQYFTGTAFASTNSDTTSAIASFTPSFNGRLTSAFNAAQDHKLRITATDNAFTPSGTSGKLSVEASGSGGLSGGGLSIVEDTRLFNPATGTDIALRPNLVSATGNRVTDENIAVSGLSTPYGIQQVLLISFRGSPPLNATFGATGGADLSYDTPPPAVPAPGGLVLALIGLPLIGLRRTLRKRAAV